jgi:CarboxypepD_reg-like domain
MMNLRLLLLLLVGSAGLTMLASAPLRAQGQVNQITFTGIVTGGNTNEALPGAYIYLPKAGRGVLANNVGYFALPVLPGDSVIFSYVGFQKQYHIIPRRLAEDTYSAVIALSEDVKTLAEVKVYPYATEELFKQAFVALRLPDEKDRANLARNTDSQYLRQMAAMTPMGATANYQNFINQQYFGRESIAGRGQATSIPFLNPFAWASFIRSVKRGELKTQEYRKQLNQAPPENIRRSDVLGN